MSDPKANNVWVESLGSSLQRGGNALDNVPELLKSVLAKEAWRCFQPRIGPEVHHERFADFVATPPVAGLGSSIDLVRRIISADTEALDLLDRALQNPVGHPVAIGNNVPDRPAGNTRDKALRRLRKDAPELHAEVLAGALTAHAAMVKAGFRHRTFTVPADDPRRIAATLRRQLDPATLTAVLALMNQEE